MRFFYEIFIRLYPFGVRISALFNPKARKWLEGRKNVFSELEKFKTENPKNIWIHCASVGEFEQGLPVIQKLKSNYKNHTLLITFFSPSGYEYAQKKHPELEIQYLPIDKAANAKKWVKTLQPSLAIFVKYEFWHHYFLELKNASIPLLMVSAVFWPELFFFKPYGKFFRKSLQNVTHFFVQNNESKKLLEQINISNISINGDTRFERTLELKKTPFTDEKIQSFIADNPIFVFGSVWNHDIPVITKIINALPKHWKVIIAPHEPNHFPYEDLNFPNTCKYSAEVESKNQVLFLDTVGLLSKTYRFGQAAYIGGGYGKGIHNILEAAVYNIPIFCGPNMDRFNEAKLLQKAGILLVLSEDTDVQVAVRSHLSLDAKKTALNLDIFEQNANVSEQIIVFIKKQAFLD